MTRRTLLSTFIALFGLTLAMLFTTVGSASAQQNPNCCSYSVDISGVKPECFPIKIKTQWIGGGISYTDIISYSTNLVFWNPIPGPCPPAPVFDWASLNLGGTQVHLGETKNFIVGNCCYKVTVTLNTNNCILVKITPC